MTFHQTVYAMRGATRTRLHVRPRTLPILVVPDFMGTRLMTADGESLAWNPLGAPFGNSPGGFKVVADELARTDVPLVPAERFRSPLAGERARVRHIAHVDALVGDVYGLLVDGLAELATDALTRHKVQVRVYCCGYDWRQDVTSAALRLAAMVDEALLETGERQVVIVAHGLGGTVARTYCRVLGGESRVLQMFLVGAATLGTPDAWRALKDGIGGVYAKQFVDRCLEADARGAVLEGVAMATEAAEAAATHASDAGFGRSLFGGLYTLLCVSMSRHPSRDETRTLVRQFPSVYQMMPGALYCREHPEWIVFDPAATGHPPTGHMIVLPTMFATGAALVFGLSRSVDPIAAVEATPQDTTGDEGMPSTRAYRNVDTLASTLLRVHDPLSAAFAGVKLGVRASRLFTTCRSAERLYGDIYTGLLDVVEERALCAAHLASALQLDRCLSVHPKRVRPDTGTNVLGDAINALGAAAEPVAAWFRAWGADFADTWAQSRAYEAAVDAHQRTGADVERTYNRLLAEREEREAQARRDADERARAQADDREEEAEEMTAYVHPATICIVGVGPRCRAAGVLVPTRVVSRDDSNVVRWMRLPVPAPVDGDGCVPADSADPPDALLASSPLGDTTRITGADHLELPARDETLQRIRDEIDALLPRFIEG